MGWGTPYKILSPVHIRTHSCCQPERSCACCLHMARNELILKLDEAVCIRMVSRPNWTQTKDMEGFK